MGIGFGGVCQFTDFVEEIEEERADRGQAGAVDDQINIPD